MILGDWNTVEDIALDFRIDLKVIQEYEILYAWYEYADYSGQADLLLRKDDILYEVHGSHCSCMGLEDQFDPEVTFKEALLHYEYSAFPKELLESL
jgi:hypothetical protein